VVKRSWHTGDSLEITTPMSLRVEGFRDNPHRFALLNGPVVLCAAVDPVKPFPGIVASEAQLLASLKPIAGRPNSFSGTSDIFRVPGGGGVDVSLTPFYQMHHHQNYVVYWDAFTPSQWEVKQQEYLAAQAEQKALEARTIDYVTTGGEQNERDHNLQGERTESGDFGDHKYRHAQPNGWFSYQLKVLPDEPQELSVTYWGGDDGRTFDVLVEGTRVATEHLGRPEHRFYLQVYPLAPALRQGKDRVTVRFQAPANSLAGGVYGLRVLKAAPAR